MVFLVYNMVSYQAGFRSRRSTSDMLFELQFLVEKVIEANKQNANQHNNIMYRLQQRVNSVNHTQLFDEMKDTSFLII